MYQYRKHLRGSFLNYFTTLIILFSFVFLSFFGVILSDGNKINGIDFIIIIFIMVGLFIFLLLELMLIYFLFLKRFKYINVTLTENEIIYNNKKKKITIPYDEIISIKYPSIKYAGGWIEIKYNGGKIRLTAVLENIGEFIYRLKESLDRIGKSDVYNEKKSFNFFKTASFVDESWQRLYENIKYIILLEYVSLLMVNFLAFFGRIQNGTSIFIVSGVITPIIGYIVAEIIIGRMVSKRVVGMEFKILRRNINKENNIIRVCIVVSILLYAFTTIFIL
ncbi:hypothetical protein ACQPUZ_02885 [Clostridium tertium]